MRSSRRSLKASGQKGPAPRWMKVTNWRNRILMFMHENAVCTRVRVRCAGVRVRVSE
jgi:hypothetical protein